MKQDYYSIEELSCYLDIATSHIERLLSTNKLKASLYLKPTPLVVLDDTGAITTNIIQKHGMFEIVGYEKLDWKFVWQGPDTIVDLYESRVRLLQDGTTFGFTTKHFASLDDILIPLESVEVYESANRKVRRNVGETDNPKAIGTLLKLVATMAIAGYSYKPTEAKSAVPSEIVKDAEQLGLLINEKTVREWLKKAAELIDGGELS